MKLINKTIQTTLLVAAIAMALQGCLKLQEDFEFNPEIPELVTFKDQTAWQWVQTNPGNEFAKMIEAIQVAGMVGYYDTDTTAKRTYLLLKDIAFTESNGVLQVVTGSRTGSLANLTAAQKAKLQNILLYHLIDKYVDQGPESLYVLFQHYPFQTMLPGTNGEMTIMRDERFRMNFNSSPTMPSTRRNTNAMLHNYIFKNGVGHLSPRYLRKVPF